MRFRLLVPLLLGGALASPATDQLAAGNYSQAYSLAVKAGDSLTASSAASLSVLFIPATPAQIQQAINAAQTAIQQHPNVAQPHLDLAAAYGMKANQSGLSPSALMAAREVKAALEKALTIDPHSARAQAGLARWHAEGYARAGRLIGASPETAKKLVAQALSGARNDVTVYLYAGATYHNLKDEGAARSTLQKALALKAKTAPERAYQEQANTLLNQLGH